MKRPLALAFLALLLVPAAGAALAGEEKTFEDHAKTVASLKTDCMEQSRRETSMRALARMKSLEAAKVLASVLDDPFVHIQELAVQLLGEMASPEIASWVAGTVLFDRRSPELRRNAAEALGLMKRSEGVEGLVKALADRDTELQAQAARALGRIGDGSSADGIGKALPGLRGEGKAAALRALAALGRLPDEKALASLFKDASWEVRVGVLDAAGAAKSPLLAGFVKSGLSDKAPPVRIAAVEAAAAAGREGGDEDVRSALAAVETALGDADWSVRAAAAQCTPVLWRAESIPLLIAAMEKETRNGGGRLLVDYREALRLHTGKEIGYDAELWRSWWGSQKDSFKLGERSKDDDPLAGLGVPGKDEKTTVRFFSIPVLTRKVAFVFDMSGSMKNPSTKEPGARPKFDVACDRLSETLHTLDKDRFFNVVIYRYFSGFPPQTKVERAFPQKLVPADAARKKAAQEFMATQEPRGWGNFYEAILAAMEIQEVDTIYFLSDGKPSRGRYVTPAGLLARLREVNRFRRVMIHTILTGEKGTDEKFMRNLAAQTWGYGVRG